MGTDRSTGESIEKRRFLLGGHWNPWRVFGVTWATYRCTASPSWWCSSSSTRRTRRRQAFGLAWALLDGALVGLCALILVEVGERFPVEKPHRLRNVAIHIAARVRVHGGDSLACCSRQGTWLAPEEQTDTLFVFVLTSVTGSLFVFLAIAAIVQAAAYQRRYSDRELDALRLRAQLTAARLESLRAKLHPHFLFNTLNGISDLIFTDPRKADALVLRLAQLLRAALDTVDDEISVRQELADVVRVLRDRARALRGSAEGHDRRRSRSVRRARAAVPRCSRSPRTRFSTASLRERAAARSRCERRVGGDRRPIRSCSSSRTTESACRDDAREGIGLRITRQRLHTLYRGAGALSVQPRPGGGTVATIELPFASVTR